MKELNKLNAIIQKDEIFNMEIKLVLKQIVLNYEKRTKENEEELMELLKNQTTSFFNKRHEKEWKRITS